LLLGFTADETHLAVRLPGQAQWRQLFPYSQTFTCVYNHWPAVSQWKGVYKAGRESGGFLSRESLAEEVLERGWVSSFPHFFSLTKNGDQPSLILLFFLKGRIRDLLPLILERHSKHREP
jgi:hypothetical protein